VVFRDPQEVNADRVHLHLEHPLVMRLLNRFLMRGFQSDALSRAAVVGTADDTAKLVILARLNLYGHGASRLHDEVLAVAAEWDPSDPQRRLRKLSSEKTSRALEDLESSLRQRLEAPESISVGLQNNLSLDVAQLREALVGFPRFGGQVGRRNAMTTRLLIDDQPKPCTPAVHTAAKGGSCCPLPG